MTGETQNLLASVRCWYLVVLYVVNNKFLSYFATEMQASFVTLTRANSNYFDIMWLGHSYNKTNEMH